MICSDEETASILLCMSVYICISFIIKFIIRPPRFSVKLYTHTSNYLALTICFCDEDVYCFVLTEYEYGMTYDKTSRGDDRALRPFKGNV